MKKHYDNDDGYNCDYGDFEFFCCSGRRGREVEGGEREEEEGDPRLLLGDVDLLSFASWRCQPSLFQLLCLLEQMLFTTKFE